MTSTRAAAGFDWLDELSAAAAEFAELLAGAGSRDLDAPISACPGWGLRDLARHLGEVHEWAAHAVREGNPEGRPGSGPGNDSELASWYAAHARGLLSLLEEAGPGRACWTMGAPRTALFWHRRQVHETRMHLWDARAALGRETPFDPRLAWDGVAEVAEVFYPRQLELGRIVPLPAALEFRPEDVDAGPIVIGEGERIVVEAPAVTALLLLWHRDDWRAEFGDPRAVGLLAHALTP